MSGGTEQQLTHAPFPAAPLDTDHQQLGGGQPDGVGLGADQVVPWGEVVAGEGGGDLVGEPHRPAVAAGPGEGDQLLAGGHRQQVAGRPLLQRLKHGRAAQIIAGHQRCGWEGRQQILAEPVEQPPLIAGGTLVVTGDRAQLSGQLPRGNQGPQRGVAVQGKQAGDAGVLGVVLVAGGAAAAGDQIRVDRQDGVAGVQEPFDQQPVASLDHHPDLGRVGLQGRDLGQELVDGGWGVLDPANLDHPLLGSPQGDEVERLGPVDPNPKHAASLLDSDPDGGAAPC